MSQFDSKVSEMLSTPVSRRRLLNKVAVTAGATIAVGAIGSQMVGAAKQATATPSASPSASPAATPAAGAIVEIATEDIKYEPTELTIAANTDVSVKVTNKGVLQHNLFVDGLKVETKLLNGGETETVIINAKPGTYQFWCTVPGHKEAGMVGVLTVK